jgi:chromosome partitioning protein
VAENIRGHYPQLTFRTMIRENISLAEAPGFGQTIYEYKASGAGANDYRRLCQEIIERKSL